MARRSVFEIDEDAGGPEADTSDIIEGVPDWLRPSEVCTIQEICAVSDRAYRMLAKLINERRSRRRAQRFVAEGERFLRFKPRTVFVRKSRWIEARSEIELALALGGEEVPGSQNSKVRGVRWGGSLTDTGSPQEKPGVGIVADQLFDYITTQVDSQGVLCIFPMAPQLEDDPGAELGLTVVLDGVSDPNNLGMILRTMEAFDVGTLVVIKGTCDIHNPKVVRCSMGAVIRGRFRYVETDGVRSLDRLLLGSKLFAVTMPAENEAHPAYALQEEMLTPQNIQEAFASGQNVAFAFGAEGPGVSKEVLTVADGCVSIPIARGVDSLNVGVSVGIVLQAAAASIEATRQAAGPTLRQQLLREYREATR